MNLKSLLVCGAGLFAVLGAPPVSGQAALDRRTSLDVNTVPPADVFGSLAQTIGCRFEIDPGVKAPVTVRLPNITVRTALNVICESIGCSWRMAGNTLRVEAAPAPKPRGPTPYAVREMLGGQTPPDFKFQSTPLRSVLEALGKLRGIEISAEEPDASRLLTIDLSSRSILEALKEISRSLELKSGGMYIAASKEPGKKLRIKFLQPAALEGAKKPPDKVKGE